MVETRSEIALGLAHVLASADHQTAGEILPLRQRPGHRQVETAAAQPLAEIAEERRVQPSRLVRAELPDEPRLDAAGARRLGEEQQAASRLRRGLRRRSARFLLSRREVCQDTTL